ncbi:MAG: AAA-like domain-containing protein [Anaerolineae bacterium]|nr:AAA-like domain-containing protein [Anaerolineae bacterium]
MRSRIFQAGGAIPPDSPTYVEREADSLVLDLVEHKELVHLIVARQMGKSCLLHRLATGLPEEYSFVWVDLSRLAGMERSRWYETLSGDVARHLGLDQVPRIVDQGGMYALLVEAAQFRPRKTVFVFDEIDSTRRLPFSDGFFSALRALYNARAGLPALRNLIFILVGATDPRKLIKDPSLSPFNVGQEVRMEEFTPRQTRQLTENLTLAGVAASDAVHERIYWWTSGQPYLTQKVCATLEGWQAREGIGRATVELVDRAVEEHILSSKANDSNLSHIRARLDQEQGAKAYLQRILSEGLQVPFEPYGALDGRITELYLIGVIKEGPDGNCVVRNRIYERMLEGFFRPPRCIGFRP